MKTRVISGGIAALGLIIITLLGKVPIGILCMLISILAVYEGYKAFGLLKNKPLAIIGMFVFPVVYYLEIMIRSSHQMFTISAFVILMFGVLVFQFPKIRFADLSMMLVLSVACTVFLAKLYFLRALPYGAWLVFLAYFGAWMTDTGAYFGGMYFGKRKLTPELSPKKTVEGSVAGVLSTVLVFLIYGIILNAAGVLGELATRGLPLNIGWLLLLGLLCGVASQVSDLFASALKRETQIKDFGAIMPGHGGALDRFDSMLVIAPLVYYFICILANL